jgi:predicted nucleotidyltransferase
MSSAEQSTIAAGSRAVLPAGSRAMLFGSRTDDSRRGGDIDLLVKPPSAVDAPQIVEMQTRLAARLYRLMGERRIDMLVAPAGRPDDRLIVTVARRQAVELVRT